MPEFVPGVEGATATIAARLADALPDHLDTITTRLGLDTPLPHPVKVTHHDTGPLGVEEWPAVLVLPKSLTALDPVDVDDTTGATYRARYAVEVLAWVRGDDYDTTALLAARYAAAIRDCLLHRTRLTPWEDRTADPSDAAIDPGSIREDYSPVSVDPAGRTIAATSTRVDAIRVEYVPGPGRLGVVEEARTLATVTATDVEVTNEGLATIAGLPAHPALAE